MPDQTTKSIIVGAPVADVFAAWADFENFPRFMENIKSVTRTGEKTTHWVAKGPMGQDVEWDAGITRFGCNIRKRRHAGLPSGALHLRRVQQLSASRKMAQCAQIKSGSVEKDRSDRIPC